MFRPQKISPDDLMVAFWTTMPPWLSLLFKLRNILVRPFGLQTGEADAERLEKAIRNGEKHGLMSVVGKTEDETVISLDDKHLKAYISVYIEAQDISLSTLVQYHNTLGVVYFNLIRPFHKIVVKSMLRQVMRERGL